MSAAASFPRAHQGAHCRHVVGLPSSVASSVVVVVIVVVVIIVVVVVRCCFLRFELAVAVVDLDQAKSLLLLMLSLFMVYCLKCTAGLFAARALSTYTTCYQQLTTTDHGHDSTPCTSPTQPQAARTSNCHQGPANAAPTTTTATTAAMATMTRRCQLPQHLSNGQQQGSNHNNNNNQDGGVNGNNNNNSKKTDDNKDKDSDNNNNYDNITRVTR
ncbi:hypothetical protein EDB89DRAFT_1907634 [Lactarius sanguifluus]|nr:hypothetical protein EDB89DRAFT_1907634 [Lactarius sanguifluus]